MDPAESESDPAKVRVLVGSIMGGVILITLLILLFTWINSPSFKVWRKRVLQWHDPAILELQDVHGDKFFSTGQRMKRGSRRMNRNDSNTLLTDSAIHSPADPTTFKEYLRTHDHNLPPPPSSISQTDSEGWSEASIAFPPAVAVSPLHDVTSLHRPSVDVYTSIKHLPQVQVMPASPESQRTVRYAPVYKSRTATTVTNSLKPSKSTSAESAWTDETSVGDEWSSVDSSACKRADVGERVPERQKELYRRLIEKAYSPDEAQQILTGRPKSGSSDRTIRAA